MRSQHLQRLLLEAEDTITIQATEIQVLRHAVLEATPHHATTGTTTSDFSGIPVSENKAAQTPNHHRHHRHGSASASGSAHTPAMMDSETHRTILDLLVTIANLRSELSLSREKHAVHPHAATTRTQQHCALCNDLIQHTPADTIDHHSREQPNPPTFGIDIAASAPVSEQQPLTCIHKNDSCSPSHSPVELSCDGIQDIEMPSLVMSRIRSRGQGTTHLAEIFI
ncbi:hypothetical protein BSLG_002946 [Batrachochytrium salamandrivorans]|nr:hypothetical protein BSLG_002946 [Batrachochytrium salamandrivorans]